jgi:hypothetical protein
VCALLTDDQRRTLADAAPSTASASDAPQDSVVDGDSVDGRSQVTPVAE